MGGSQFSTPRMAKFVDDLSVESRCLRTLRRWSRRQPTMEQLMITRSQLTVICRRLEDQLQQAGFVFDDVQFDEFAQTLSIVVDDRPRRRLSSSSRTDCREEATIDARVLWELLRNLVRHGMNPVIQFQHKRQDKAQSHEVLGSGNSAFP